MTVEEKNRYQNLIQAFALGALDKDDFIEIVHVLQTNEDFATQELGEYQNLTALWSLLSIQRKFHNIPLTEFLRKLMKWE
ncbi:MAG: hypothetical protein IPJ75_00620 [Ignavibacteriales bacterium]|nr:hypothetical protein [Ignavibacteriales bacterium]